MSENSGKILDAIIRAFTVTKKDVILFILGIVVLFGSVFAINALIPVDTEKTRECVSFIKEFGSTKASDEIVGALEPSPDGGVVVGIGNDARLRMLLIINDKIAGDLRSRMTLKQIGSCIHSTSGWKYNVFTSEIETNNNMTL